MFTSLMLVAIDTRKDYGEPRKIGFGFIRGRLMVIAFTEREPNSIRIISAGKANTREEAYYQEAVADELGEKLTRSRTGEIDTSDIPEQGKAFFKRAMLRLPEPKTAVTIRLDRQVLNWFKTKGPGYQTRINALLRAYMEAHKG